MLRFAQRNFAPGSSQYRFNLPLLGDTRDSQLQIEEVIRPNIQEAMSSSPFVRDLRQPSVEESLVEVVLKERWIAPRRIVNLETYIERRNHTLVEVIKALDRAHRIAVGVTLVVGELPPPQQEIVL